MGVRSGRGGYFPGLVGWLAFGLSLTACDPAKMAVPPELSTVQPMQVEGRQAFKFKENFTFGPYEVLDVNRGWTTTTKWNLVVVGSSTARQDFEFTVLKNKAPLIKAQASIGAEMKDLSAHLVGLPMKFDMKDLVTYAVTFQRPGVEDPSQALRMVLAGKHQEPLNGWLSVPGGAPIEVKGTGALEGSSVTMPEASGYSFVRGGQTLGAVEVMNNGRLWLAQGLSEADQEVVVAGSAGMLLFKSLQLKSTATSP